VYIQNDLWKRIKDHGSRPCNGLGKVTDLPFSVRAAAIVTSRQVQADRERVGFNQVALTARANGLVTEKPANDGVRPNFGISSPGRATGEFVMVELKQSTRFP
jgi:hypothetical protein